MDIIKAFGCFLGLKIYYKHEYLIDNPTKMKHLEKEIYEIKPNEEIKSRLVQVRVEILFQLRFLLLLSFLFTVFSNNSTYGAKNISAILVCCIHVFSLANNYHVHTFSFDTSLYSCTQSAIFLVWRSQLSLCSLIVFTGSFSLLRNYSSSGVPGYNFI